MKSSKRGYKKFFRKKYFLTKNLQKTSIFGHFWSKNVKDKNFWSKKFFWSESIKNGPKRILKRKSRFRKFFLIVTCLSHFFEKLGHKSKKWLRQKFLVEKIFLVGIESEWSKTYFKTKISISKIFSHYNCSLLT